MRPAFAPLAFVFAAVPACMSPAWAQDAPNPSFNLVNRGQDVITEVYATPSTNGRWGGDRLQRSNLPPGKTFPVRLPADGACVYDIRVVYAGRPAEEMRRVDVCRVEGISFPGGRASSPAANRSAAANDPSFRLVNRSQAEINEVYASPTGEDDWGSDRLGDDTVGAGATRVVRLPTGQCTWDVRVVFADGASLERRKLDLCSLTDLRVP